MHGIILCQTQIVMSTGATFNGRAFAQTAATLDANQVTDPIITSFNDETIITTFFLKQNYPNPFNPSTEIQYGIENAANVTLKVYNILGSEIATLVNEYQEAGGYSIPFNTNDLVDELSSGIYFYRLQAGSNVSTKKIVLMK
ncbi:MAG: T9SS type A sorting domain-containing protein [Melioribacteraceae bacterium]|nr:T9SS type A sorting domain-containing protein [Melioribacteraceae bacterium]MCF8356480.1 T9SS type A sorting domain-containing protein [Melioribacteraceae bacterium]MCF8396059.1 T9SS type A sorting domain-containing protein [Melioribacteraceae bacterium]MCF8418957.1 T9SS type A sorting domain-containing protein [Melioribacteraceae bacterium]